MRFTLPLLAALAITLTAPLASAQRSDAPGDPGAEAALAAAAARVEALWAITQRVDGAAERSDAGNVFSFSIAERPLTFVCDVAADRMRLITPIAPEGGVTPELMRRLMQANFDSALDARYAIAQDILWGVFIHPLTSLTDADYVSALGQTVNVAVSFGTTFSSGALTYGGGDSQNGLSKLLEELERKNEQPL